MSLCFASKYNKTELLFAVVYVPAKKKVLNYSTKVLGV